MLLQVVEPATYKCDSNKLTSYLTKLSQMEKLMDMVLVNAMAADALVISNHDTDYPV